MSNSEVRRWLPERQVGPRACLACKASEDAQVLPGHNLCLPEISGLRTADGVTVVLGLPVWDYDLKLGTVTEVCASFQGTPSGPLGIVAWHYVTRADDGSQALMDGSRIVTRHPFTSSPAAAAYEEFMLRG